MNSLKKPSWHYLKRIKELESFALKIETGRFDTKNIFEDFFACTLVVENSLEIHNALERIEKYFIIEERKPDNEHITNKFPESFPYDDLRLYAKIRPVRGMPLTPLHDIRFEIQIKTFLQHAWTLATHDLIYKGEEISWAKQRVAYQIKAMLEHAEMSIHEIDKIKESDMIAKENDVIERLKQTKDFLLKNWSIDQLPKDHMRISQNISNLMTKLKLSPDEIQEFLDVETKSGRGRDLMDLSPYSIIIQSIINQKPEKLESFCSNKYPKGKVVIPSEIDISDLGLNDSKIFRF